MKITLFTANQPRHNYFVNKLSEICDELFVIQESRSVVSIGNYNKDSIPKVMRKYLSKMTLAQKKIFGNSYISSSKKKIKILPLVLGDLNKCSIKNLKPFLKSDLFIVFGSSYIKGKLLNLLIKKKAINIHMGISPFYRGSDCNFWALYDNKAHLVGSTIHLLSKGLDSGPILYHAVSQPVSNSFIFTMASVKSAFISLIEKIKKKEIYKILPVKQLVENQIRYSTKKEFNEKIVNNFFKKKIKIKKDIDRNFLLNPYILKKKLFY